MSEHHQPIDGLTVPIWKKSPGSSYYFDLRNVEDLQQLPKNARLFCKLIRESEPTAPMGWRKKQFARFVAEWIAPVREFVRISPQAIGDSVSEPVRLDFVDRTAKHVARVQLWFRRELIDNKWNDGEFDRLCVDAQALAEKYVSMLGLGAGANEINCDAVQRRSLERLQKAISEVAEFATNSVVEASQSEAAGVADKGEPNDIISTRVAIQRFRVSRVTLQRAFRAGKIRSYRRPNAPQNAQHQFSYAELDQLYERRQN